MRKFNKTGRLIRLYRKEASLSIDNLSYLIGTSSTYFYDIERGHSPLSKKKYAAICNELGIDKNLLIDTILSDLRDNLEHEFSESFKYLENKNQAESDNK